MTLLERSVSLSPYRPSPHKDHTPRGDPSGDLEYRNLSIKPRDRGEIAERAAPTLSHDRPQRVLPVCTSTPSLDLLHRRPPDRVRSLGELIWHVVPLVVAEPQVVSGGTRILGIDVVLGHALSPPSSQFHTTSPSSRKRTPSTSSHSIEFLTLVRTLDNIHEKMLVGGSSGNRSWRVFISHTCFN